MSKLPDHVGIDFGNHSVKAVELRDVHTPTPTLENFGSQPTPQGVINSEDETHQGQLADALKELFAASRIKNKKVVMALPEFSVFTRFVELPGIKEEEITDAVYYEAKQYIPIPIDEVQMSFMKIGFNEDRRAQRVLLVAAPKKIIDVYVNVAMKAGLEPLAIETESIAIGRAMYRATKSTQVVILDFGAQSTDMSIMSEGNLVFSQSISIGSDALTQAIVNKFNFEYNQAEEYKRNYGLNKDMLEGKVYSALTPIMDSIVTEVLRGVEFYKSKTLMAAPNTYLLNGDGALLPGLATYIAGKTGAESSVADPWTNINVPKNFNDIISKSRPSFSVAIGLALKNE